MAAKIAVSLLLFTCLAVADASEGMKKFEEGAVSVFGDIAKLLQTEISSRRDASTMTCRALSVPLPSSGMCTGSFSIKMCANDAIAAIASQASSIDFLKTAMAAAFASLPSSIDLSAAQSADLAAYLNADTQKVVCNQFLGEVCPFFGAASTIRPQLCDTNGILCSALQQISAKFALCTSDADCASNGFDFTKILASLVSVAGSTCCSSLKGLVNDACANVDQDQLNKIITQFKIDGMESVGISSICVNTANCNNMYTPGPRPALGFIISSTVRISGLDVDTFKTSKQSLFESAIGKIVKGLATVKVTSVTQSSASRRRNLLAATLDVGFTVSSTTLESSSGTNFASQLTATGLSTNLAAEGMTFDSIVSAPAVTTSGSAATNTTVIIIAVVVSVGGFLLLVLVATLVCLRSRKKSASVGMLVKGTSHHNSLFFVEGGSCGQQQGEGKKGGSGEFEQVHGPQPVQELSAYRHTGPSQVALPAHDCAGAAFAMNPSTHPPEGLAET